METNVSLTAEAEAARDEVINVVNNFYEKLTAIPEIRLYEFVHRRRLNTG